MQSTLIQFGHLFVLYFTRPTATFIGWTCRYYTELLNVSKPSKLPCCGQPT